MAWPGLELIGEQRGSSGIYLGVGWEGRPPCSNFLPGNFALERCGGGGGGI